MATTSSPAMPSSSPERSISGARPRSAWGARATEATNAATKPTATPRPMPN